MIKVDPSSNKVFEAQYHRVYEEEPNNGEIFLAMDGGVDLLAYLWNTGESISVHFGGDDDGYMIVGIDAPADLLDRYNAEWIASLVMLGVNNTILNAGVYKSNREDNGVGFDANVALTRDGGTFYKRRILDGEPPVSPEDSANAQLEEMMARLQGVITEH